MDILRLREYIELSRRLNFTVTAKEVHLSQPALSNHIHALEEEAGSLLIERVPRGEARLTPAGQRFLEMAKEIVSSYDRGMDDLRSMKHEIEGTIRMRTPRHEYSRPLLDYVYEFRAAHPNIEVVLLPWTPEGGYSDVASGRADCAYVGQAPCKETDKAQGMGQTPYATEECLLWVDRSHRLAHENPLRIAALDGSTLAIPSNQKNESWVLTMTSMAHENGIEIELDEKYCDSLEDFLMKRVGPDDLVVNYRGLFSMSAFSMRPDRVAIPFDPPLMLRSSIAHAREPGNPALRLFLAFLREKYEHTVQ